MINLSESACLRSKGSDSENSLHVRGTFIYSNSLFVILFSSKRTRFISLITDSEQHFSCKNMSRQSDLE